MLELLSASRQLYRQFATSQLSTFRVEPSCTRRPGGGESQVVFQKLALRKRAPGDRVGGGSQVVFQKSVWKKIAPGDLVGGWGGSQVVFKKSVWKKEHPETVWVGEGRGSQVVFQKSAWKKRAPGGGGVSQVVFKK